MKSIITIVIITGCNSQPAPNIKLVLNEAITPETQQLVRDGARLWSQAGIDSSDSINPECPPQWWLGLPSSCNITIHVDFASTIELNGFAGLTDHISRMTTLNERLSNLEMISVAAHEIGHSLFYTSDHLLASQHGVMEAISEGYTYLTDDDLEYASTHTNNFKL